MSKNTRNRILLTALAALLLVTLAIGGTMAWLQDKTEAVTNTFTPAKINIALDETYNTDTDNDKVNDAWTAQLIPNKQYAKDPKVTVTGDAQNVDAYVFVKVTNTAASYLDFDLFYEVDTNWKQVPGTTDVWYYELAASSTNWTCDLISDNTVTVKDLTTTTMASGNVELSFQAWIIQQQGWNGDVAAAYAQASGN